MMIQQKSGNIPACSPLQLLGSRLLHLFLTKKSTLQTFFFVHQSSLILYIFQVPLFYASLPDDPLTRVSLFCSFHFLLIFISASQNSIRSRESTFLSSISLHFPKIRMFLSSHAGSSLSIRMQQHQFLFPHKIFLLTFLVHIPQ